MCGLTRFHCNDVCRIRDRDMLYGILYGENDSLRVIYVMGIMETVYTVCVDIAFVFLDDLRVIPLICL